VRPGNTGCTVFAPEERLAKIFVNWRPCLSGEDIREAGRLRLVALDGRGLWPLTGLRSLPVLEDFLEAALAARFFFSLGKTV